MVMKRTVEWMDEWVGGGMDKWVGGGMDKWVEGWMSGWVGGRIIKRALKCGNDRGKIVNRK